MSGPPNTESDGNPPVESKRVVNAPVTNSLDPAVHMLTRDELIRGINAVITKLQAEEKDHSPDADSDYQP